MPDPLNPAGRYLTFDSNGTENALLEVYDPSGRHAAGEAVFYRDWLDTLRGAEPLAGPDLDQSTCPACHVEAALRAGSAIHELPPLIAKPATAEQSRRFGTQINTLRHDGGGAEAAVRIEYVESLFEYPNGEQRMLRKPVGRIDGDEAVAGPVRLRAAPLLFGWGLLERVDPSMIAHFHDPDDRNGDGISGKLVHAGGSGHGAPAIFGWKNAQVSLRNQIEAALANDMGVLSAGTCGADCEPEIEESELDALTDYVRYLGVPNRREFRFRRGQDLFGLTGCSNCHISVLWTSAGGPAELSEQLVWPYSDLMLHDMGAALADPGDAPDAREWRTAPLWGLGVVEQHLPGRGFLHDGRAATIEEAVLWHDGEAAESRMRFAGLSRADREVLLAYVRSL